MDLSLGRLADVRDRAIRGEAGAVVGPERRDGTTAQVAGWPREPIGADGVVLRLGESWADPLMELSPEEREPL